MNQAARAGAIPGLAPPDAQLLEPPVETTMKPTLRATMIVWLTLLATEEVRAHGGMYFGPTPGLPPGLGGPNTGGPGTPGPSGPGPVTGGGGGGGFFAGSRKNLGASYTGWDTWWRLNKHPYLNLRARLASRYTVTGLGRDGQGADPAAANEVSARPSFVELKDRVIPLLKKLLAEDDPDIVDSAVLALARVTPAAEAALVFPELKDALAHKERSVKQSAILALGVLGDAAAAPLLLEIVQDTGAGRKLLRITHEVDEVQRAMAAVALGLLSHQDAIDPLRAIAARTPDAKIDLRAGSILGLGLFGTGAFEIVPFLSEQLDDARTSELVRAQIPVALGRLGEPARPLLPALLELTESRKTRDLLRQSCVVALGRLAAPEDAEVVETLFRLVARSSDEGTRHFAMIAIAEIGARAAAAGEDRHSELLRRIDRQLLKTLTRPPRKSEIPWAALACALHGRGYPAGAEPRRIIEEKLFDAFREVNNPDHRAGLAIALGLIEASRCGDELLDEMLTTGDRSIQGSFAEALGLMRHEAAREPLKRLLADESDPEFRVKIATGLGLMGDPDVSELLAQELDGASTLWVTSAVAKALGNVGDRGAVPTLIELAENRRRPGLARAFAAVALGLIGEKTALPWNTRISAGANYMAAFYTQTEIMDIL